MLLFHLACRMTTSYDEPAVCVQEGSSCQYIAMYRLQARSFLVTHARQSKCIRCHKSNGRLYLTCHTVGMHAAVSCSLDANICCTTHQPRGPASWQMLGQCATEEVYKTCCKSKYYMSSLYSVALLRCVIKCVLLTSVIKCFHSLLS
jgi:hypothetical protein